MVRHSSLAESGDPFRHPSSGTSLSLTKPSTRKSERVPKECCSAVQCCAMPCYAVQCCAVLCRCMSGAGGAGLLLEARILRIYESLSKRISTAGEVLSVCASQFFAASRCFCSTLAWPVGSFLPDAFARFRRVRSHGRHQLPAMVGRRRVGADPSSRTAGPFTLICTAHAVKQHDVQDLSAAACR